MITIWNYTIILICIIISGANICFVSLFLEQFQIWNMKHIDMSFYYSSYKQNFFHLRFSCFSIAVTCPSSTPSVLSFINRICTVLNIISKSSLRL